MTLSFDHCAVFHSGVWFSVITTVCSEFETNSKTNW